MNDVLAAVEAAPNAVDWTTVLLALISALATIATAVISVFAAKFASNANTSAKEAKEQSTSTAKAVDGVRAELVAAAESKGKAEGVLIGVAASKDTPAPSTPTTPSE